MNERADEMIRVHAFVSGKVQGVGFREATRRRAVELQVSGWTRNLSDGRVEVLAEGERASVEQLVVFLHEGPRSAEVRRVDAEYDAPRGDLGGFEIKR